MNRLTAFFLGAALAAAVALIVRLLQRKRQRERLLALTVYLERAGCGKETSLTRIEDEFSILEDEIYKTVSELWIARERAQQERRMQADNLADIAHQLKTPLTSMSLMTQLLATEVSAEQQEYMERIDSQLSRLNWLTGALLTMSRLDAGAVEFSTDVITFEELAARSIEPMEQLLTERKQTVSLCGGDVPVSCDSYWTAEALVNLIKNCSEHTPPGGTITLTAVNTPLYLQMTVMDSGKGFLPDELPHLFRRFFRGKNSSKDSIGIGLALCRAIIEGQEGVLHAENRPEGGARFVIRFYP